MSSVVRSVFGVVAAAILVGSGTGVAQAEPDARAQGSVLVFANEFTPSTRFENPSGCQSLGTTAHLLVNLTDSDIRVYGDPLCLTLSLVVPPGTGAHIQSPISSFSA